LPLFLLKTVLPYTTLALLARTEYVRAGRVGPAFTLLQCGRTVSIPVEWAALSRNFLRLSLNWENSQLKPKTNGSINPGWRSLPGKGLVRLRRQLLHPPLQRGYTTGQFADQGRLSYFGEGLSQRIGTVVEYRARMDYNHEPMVNLGNVASHLARTDRQFAHGSPSRRQYSFWD
jgi:hypothetical protein